MSIIDMVCPACSAPEMHLSVEVAACDENLLDIVLTCSDCHHCRNAFIAIDGMMEIER